MDARRLAVGATRGTVPLTISRDTTNRAVLLEADTPALQHTMQAAGFQRYQYDLFSRTLSPADPHSSSPAGWRG